MVFRGCNFFSRTFNHWNWSLIESPVLDTTRLLMKSSLLPQPPDQPWRIIICHMTHMSDSKRLASHPRPQKTTKGLSHLHSRTKTDGLTRDALRFSSWEPTPRKDYWESQWDLALAHMPMKLRPSLNNRGEIWSSLEKKRGRERREGDLLF